MKTIQVKVKPHARASSFEAVDDGSWLAQLKSPPVEGKANEELIMSGATGRMKLVRIDAD